MTAQTSTSLTLSLQELNSLDEPAFVAALEGVYEHSPWVARHAWAMRPFQSLTHLLYALATVVRLAPPDLQLGLIRAHPELAGKAAVAGHLTAESTDEQSRAGLTHCTPEQFASLQRLNADYNTRFGWPFILAVRGPRGLGMSREEIIATFERRLRHDADFERGECLRNIHRIAEIRVHDKFGVTPQAGNAVWDWSEALAVHTEAESIPGQPAPLTVTYLTAAHQACARQLMTWMNDCGFDEVSLDAVGNVVGIYHGTDPTAPRLLTGSHYDTVRNGGKYDGRLGIFVPMACVRQLHTLGRRLAHGLEVVAFAEEEGQRFAATFLGSGPLVGDFPEKWLDLLDANGVSLRDAMQSAGLPAQLADIQALARDPSQYLGFVEVHIEQGPVLQAMDMPLGVVTSINGSLRYAGQAQGVACHAGTTPMPMRHDAAAAVAELLLYTEQRALQDQDLPTGGSVGTVGIVNVPQGSINVVPGRCDFTLDIRAPNDAQRDAVALSVLSHAESIAQRRGVQWHIQQTLRAPAAPSAPSLQVRWEAAVAAMGIPVVHLPSGAGHDAMKLHQKMPQAMLFVRGGNAGISHNPLETITNHDAQRCVDTFMHLLEHL